MHGLGTDISAIALVLLDETMMPSTLSTAMAMQTGIIKLIPDLLDPGANLSLPAMMRDRPSISETVEPSDLANSKEWLKPMALIIIAKVLSLGTEITKILKSRLSIMSID